MSYRAGLCALLLLGGGCARQAPGPSECHHFALEALGVSPGQLRHAQIRSAVDELTLRCISAGYDAATRDCLLSGGTEAACVDGARPTAPQRPRGGPRRGPL